MRIVAYLKPLCGWSKGVRAIFKKYDLNFEERDIVNYPENYAEMVQLSGQHLAPCVIINDVMLADVSGEEIENYMLANDLICSNNMEPEEAINCGCHSGEHAVLRSESFRFF